MNQVYAELDGARYLSDQVKSAQRTRAVKCFSLRRVRSLCSQPARRFRRSEPVAAGVPSKRRPGR